MERRPLLKFGLATMLIGLTKCRKQNRYCRDCAPPGELFLFC
jgi:hypothetical protein